MFVDYQNVFQRARAAFHSGFKSRGSSVQGQIAPHLLGEYLSSTNTPFRAGSESILHEVRVYRGQPRTNNRKAFEPWQRQRNEWLKHPQVRLVTRPVGGSPSNPIEKGVDVELALDFLAGAFDGDYDVGVLFSMDRDLAPAIEKVSARNADILLETVTWRTLERGRRFSLVDSVLRQRHRIWNHELTEIEYNRIRDRSNYTLQV